MILSDKTKTAKGKAEGARTEDTPTARIAAEFAQSTIPLDLTQANVVCLAGDCLLETLIANAIEAIQGKNRYWTAPARKLRGRYEAVAQGGAWAAWGTTVDGAPGKVPIIKPFCPRRDGKGKIIKYETPPKCPATPLLPEIPPQYLEKIANRWGVKLTNSAPPWQEILAHPEIPIAITEGLKKALALTAQGLPTIAIRGITQWHAKGSSSPYPEIAQFCQNSRKIYLVFDQDEKIKTCKDVTKQALKLGKAIENLSKHEPYFLSWPGKTKGIDDYLFSIEESRRSEAISALLESALSIKKFKRRKETAESQFFFSKIHQKNNEIFVQCQENFISNLPLPENKIIAVSAPIGAGKTTEITRIATEWRQKHAGYRIVLSPRNSLGMQIAEKIGIPHIHDYESDADLVLAIEACKGVALCPDSLHRLPNSVWKSQQNLLILDEANQVIRHVINGDTLRQKWISHNQLFKKILKESQGVIAAEADLPHYCLEFLQGVSGKSAQTFQYRPNPSLPKWTCMFYDYPAAHRALFDKYLIAAGATKKIMIVSTSKIYLEILERIFIGLDRKVVRIDSDTNENGQFDSFFADPDNWLKKEAPEILMLSPSAESGVSIQAGISAEDGYFREIWGYFPTLTPDTAVQLLGRYRPAAPRHIFCPQFVSPDPLEMPSPGAIKERINFLATGYAKLYGIQEQGAKIDEEYQHLYENYFAQEKAVNFHAKRIYRTKLKAILGDAGHAIEEATPPTEKEAATMPPVRTLFKNLREEILRERATLFASLTPGPEHTLDWARQILEHPQNSKRDRTLANKVLKLSKFPEITTQLNDPNFVYFAYHKNYARHDKQAEMRVITELGEDCLIIEKENVGKIIGASAGIKPKHKLPTKILAGAKILNYLGILRLLELEEYDNNHEIIKEIKAKALQCSAEIWALLRINVNPTQSGVTIAHKLLKRLGLKAVTVRQPRRPGNKRPRLYKVEDPANCQDPTAEQETYRHLLHAWRAALRRAIAQAKQRYDQDHTPPPNPTPPPQTLPNPPPP